FRESFRNVLGRVIGRWVTDQRSHLMRKLLGQGRQVWADLLLDRVADLMGQHFEIRDGLRSDHAGALIEGTERLSLHPALPVRNTHGIRQRHGLLLEALNRSLLLWAWTRCGCYSGASCSLV